LSATGFTVNSSADLPDSAAGDGLCQTEDPAECTLRAAIQEANATADVVTISFDAATNGVPITLALIGADEEAAIGDLDITGTVTLLGNGIDQTVIRGCNDGPAGTNHCAPVDRLFNVKPSGSLSVQDLWLRRGRMLESTDGGSAVLNDQGTFDAANVIISNHNAVGQFTIGAGALNTTGGNVTLDRVTVRDNSAANPTGDTLGGGMFIGGGTVKVTNSIFAWNTILPGPHLTSGLGGAILVDAGTLNMTNSTIYANGAPTTGGIRARSGLVKLSFVTISNNAGGGLVASAIVKNSILSDNPGGCIASAILFQGNNLSSDPSCGSPGLNIWEAANDYLLPPAPNGGATLNLALGALSPAIDAAVDCTDLDGVAVTHDQRGVIRNPAPAGKAACDLGAYERRSALVVNTSVDAVDAAVGDGFCQTAVSQACSLRAAVQEANAREGPDDITFSSTMNGLPITLSLAGIDDLAAGGDLDVVGGLTIAGNGAHHTIVRGCDDGDGTVGCLGIDRLFHIVGNASSLSIGDVALRRGTPTNALNAGGAVLNEGGSLAVARVVFANNRVVGAVGTSRGGAIASNGRTTLVDRSSFTSNSVTGGTGDGLGGALSLIGGLGAIQRSTFESNVVASQTGADRGGAIHTSAARLVISDSTLSANAAEEGGGIYGTNSAVSLTYVTLANGTSGGGAFGIATIMNSILAHNAGGNCTGAAKTFLGRNMSSDASCSPITPTDPLLQPLADNGGFGRTHALSPNSPAIAVVEACTEPGFAVWSFGDQRGAKRGATDECDLGAHEEIPLTVHGDPDGCPDAQELAHDIPHGGRRNPVDRWDFFDVNSDRSADVQDALLILAKFGEAPGTQDYDPLFDREVRDQSRPWITSPSTGAAASIDLLDVLNNLRQFGHSCVPPQP
jgi:CSLREA domain-containing protein